MTIHKGSVMAKSDPPNWVPTSFVVRGERRSLTRTRWCRRDAGPAVGSLAIGEDRARPMGRLG